MPHFRTDILRRIVGWDAWNVTEDADLGLRIARFGYRVGTIEATTFEDAPSHFANWMGQRARWTKGWMQTLSVFLRSPRRPLRKIGAVQNFAALCTMSSLLAGPLFGPFYGLRLAQDLIFGELLAPPTIERLAFASINLAIALFGSLAFVLPALLAMKRRGLKASPLLLLTPVYLAFLTAAAWLALWGWTRKPFVWNKTAHFPHPASADQAGAAATNLPAKASAISARVLSTP
ncbi:MAG: glycosyltransferase family 2 protein [Alphaproteobacteria bacterium]|nr:glycosyltransferase family 2 protein [Alphaproteobacteria bacterium]